MYEVCVCGLYSVVIYYTLVTTMIRKWILWCDFLIIFVRWMMEIYSLMDERWQGLWRVSLFCLCFFSIYVLKSIKIFLPNDNENNSFMSESVSQWGFVSTSDLCLRW